jgi:hypothetical protein
MELFIISGGPFEAPGLDNIMDSGGAGGSWSASLINPGYIFASEAAGIDTFWLNGDLHFAGDITSALTFDILFWDNDFIDLGDKVLAFSVRQIWDPDNQEFLIDAAELDPDGYNRAPVPEPATILLLGFGLAGLVGLGRKRLKKQG